MGFTAVNQVKKQLSESAQNDYSITTESRNSVDDDTESHGSFASFHSVQIKSEANGSSDLSPQKNSPYYVRPAESKESLNFAANFMNPFMFFQGKSRANPPLNMSTVERRGDNLDTTSHLDADGKRVFNLAEAPTFRPTVSEFHDPIEYVKSITAESKKYGIAKIVPPKEWNIQFCLDTEVFWFKTRRQNLRNNGITSVAADKFVESLHYFHRLNRTGGMTMPNIDRRPLDIFRLHQCVSLRGGFQEVCKKKLWAQIGRELGYSGRIMSSLSSSLKAAYQKVLYPYDLYLEENGASELVDGIHTPLFEIPKNQKSKEKEEDDLHKRTHSFDESDQRMKFIKLDNGTKVSTVLDEVKEISTAYPPPRISSSETYFKRIKPTTDAEIINHEWPFDFPVMTDDEKDFDFRSAPTYNLRQFQQKSAMFKFNYFASHLKDKNIVSQHDVEKEYWKLVMDPAQNVEVEIGRDLHSSIYGSAFPKVELYPDDSNCFDGWNLNTLAYNPQSFLRYVSSEIPYLADPWINIGMIFSTKSWHFQDFFSNLMHYHHFGDAKTWYSVPESDFDKMKKLLQQTIGEENIADNPRLLLEHQYMFSPELLKENGINVYAVNQVPGEFVVVFPKSWQAEVDQGFNLCENVNFSAGTNWLDYGLDCLKMYKNYGMEPPFSIPHALTSASETGFHLGKIGSDIINHFEIIELSFRSKIREKFPELCEKQDINLAEHLCCITKDICYFSTIREIAAEDIKFFSLPAFLNLEIDEEDLKRFTLIYVEQDEDLRSHIKSLENGENVNPLDAWIEKVQKLLSGSPKVVLSAVENLLREGERLRRSPNSFHPLKSLVDAAKDFRTRLRSELHLDESVEQFQNDASLETFDSLVEESKKTWFICPEIEELFSRSRKITAYRKQITDLMKESPLESLSMCLDLLKTGRQFHVDLPEIKDLERALAHIEWSNKVSEAMEKKFQFTEFNQLISEGGEVGIEANNPLMTKLLHAVEENNSLQQQALQLLESGVIQRRSLVRILSEAQTCELDAAIYKDLQNAYARAQKFDASAVELKKKMKNPTIYERPLYSDAKIVLKEAAIFDDKALSHDIGKGLRTVEDWMRIGKRLYGKTKTQLYVLGSHLKHVEERDSRCFDLGVTYENDFFENDESAYSSQKKRMDTQTTRLHLCICREPEYGLIMSCFVCKEWYHARCLSVGRGKDRVRREIFEFICPICDWSVSIYRDSSRATLEKLETWMSSAYDLPYEPDEFELAGKILEKALKYRDFIRDEILSPDQITKKNIPKFKYYIRRLEGAETALVEELVALYGILKHLDPDRYDKTAVPDVTMIASGTRKKIDD